MADERDERPRPQYGELAPEGWEWKPPSDDPAPAGSASGSGSSGKLTGVPHNLGAPGATAPSSSSAAPAAPPSTSIPQQTSAPQQTSSAPAPYRADDPQPGAKPQQPAPQQLAAAPAQPKNRQGDRIITIVLLGLGALGALYTAASLQQMPSTFSMMATALEVDGFSMPSSLQTISSVGALAVLAVYALNVIFSIQRLRRKKLTFWVPLTAAAIAGVLLLIFTSIGISQSPELMQALSQPDAPTRMLEYMSTLQR